MPDSGLPLTAHKSNATMLPTDGKDLTVSEFFAVGDPYAALLLCAVKGGVRLRQGKISAVFKVLFWLKSKFFYILKLYC